MLLQGGVCEFNHLNLTMKDGTLISTSKGPVPGLASTCLPSVAKLKGHGTCNVIRATREGEEARR